MMAIYTSNQPKKKKGSSQIANKILSIYDERPNIHYKFIFHNPDI